jgi:hypothetical protein
VIGMRTRPGIPRLLDAWTVRSATRHGEGGPARERPRCGGQPTPSCPRRVAPDRSPRQRRRRDVAATDWVPGFCSGGRLWRRGLLAA